MEYRERGVFNASEMVVEIQSVEAMGNKDLFVVGRSPACIPPCCSWSPLLSVSIGLLLNTKWIIELVILNIARNKGIMSDQSFTVIGAGVRGGAESLITAMVSPFLAMVVKPPRRLVFYKRRTVAWAHPEPESELRILACVRVPRDVPALLTLLDVVTPSSRSPVGVHALHLIEFVGRSSSSTHPCRRRPPTTYDASVHGLSHTKMQFKHISHAFVAYEEQAVGVSMRTMAAVLRPCSSSPAACARRPPAPAGGSPCSCSPLPPVEIGEERREEERWRGERRRG
uniref:Uncharacterized protein n=1 Tax=Oryza glumipatula TaxID=40148 RepID=A0A0E0AAX7_9ORYZ